MDFSKLCDVQLISLADYSVLTGTEETLAPGEAILHISHVNYDFDRITLTGDGQALTYSIRQKSTGRIPGGTLSTFPTILLVVPDLPQAAQQLAVLTAGELSPIWSYFFDTDLDAQGQGQLYEQLSSNGDLMNQGEWVSFDSQARGERDFMELYRGLLYLGVILSVVFLFAAVLMLYYKQISEGYEDQGRFQILEKVGMSAQEVRRSINSQLLTVFFLPLGLAGIHLIMASPLLRQMLRVFDVSNTRIYWVVTLGCFLVFGLIYLLVYRVTSNAYYRIVRGGKRA